MSQQTFVATSSQSAGQKRSIVDVLQELQRQIQAHGQGPFTPEQAKEVETLKLFYLKAKQQYDKQLQLIQSSSMASSQAQASIQPTLSSAQGIGMASVQNPQQIIKAQQPNISYQIQRTQGNIAGLVSTQSVMNSKLIGQPGIQLVASSQGISASQGGITVVTGIQSSGTNNPIVNVIATKPQVIQRTQAQIKQTANIATNPVTANGASLLQQQQLRMMGLAAGNGPNVATGIQHGLAPSKPPSSGTTAPTSQVQVLDRKKIQDLLREIDPRETMDDDVEELLLQIADDFIENIVSNACKLAKHRKSNTLETKDIQLHLDRQWNMWIPGFGNEDLRPPKKLVPAEAHRQRLAIIKKSLKK